MKYFLVLLASLFILGCVSTQNNQASNKNKYNRNQSTIIDEEFDLLIAPEYDYESDVPYAEQIKVTQKEQTNTSGSKTVKPAKRPVGAQAN